MCGREGISKDYQRENPNPSHAPVLEAPTKQPSEVQANDYLHWIKRVLSEYPMHETHGRFPRGNLGQYAEELEKPKRCEKGNPPRPNELVKGEN